MRALQNKMPTGQFRGGRVDSCAVTERLVDLAARARGEDVLEFRRRNLLRAEDMPCVTAARAHMFGLSHEACLDRLLVLMELPRLRVEIAAMRRTGRWIGLGFATSVELTASGSEAYGRAGIPVASVDTVIATLQLSGEITAQASVSEIGQGIRQGLAQVIADAVGVDAGCITVSTGDTDSVPHGGGAWASRGAAIGGEAAWGAGRALREQILQAAGALLQTPPEALDIVGGRIVDQATGSDRMGLDDIARTVILQGYELPSGTRPQLTVANLYRRERDTFLPNNGVQASLVEINPQTGMVRVLRHWAVGDCGRIINPLLVEQVRAA